MNPGNDPARLVARLRTLLAKGTTLLDAGARVGLGKSTVHDLAARHDLDRRRRSLAREKRRKIERGIRAAKLTVSELARKHRVAKSTVSDLRAKIIALEAGTLGATRMLKRPRRCPNGHLVILWPCRTCFPPPPGS